MTKYMNDQKFLQAIFDGYAINYRTLSWHTVSSDTDMTAIELDYFAGVGRKLGFMSIREKDRNDIGRRPDLYWCEKPFRNENKWEHGRKILYLERENKNHRWEETLSKIFRSTSVEAVPYLIVIFGWISFENLRQAKETAKRFVLEQQNENTMNLLMISWIGAKADDTSELEGYTNCGGSESTRTAKAAIDSTGYWHFHSLSDWTPLVSS